MNKDLLDVLMDFPGRSVLIVGDVMLDEYIWGEVRRISPEAPVPVVEVRRRVYVPGGAGNTAANVVSMGGRAWLGGAVGQDPPAEVLRQVLREHGIDDRGLVVDPARPTTTKTRIVARNQQIVRVDMESRLPLPPELEDALLGYAASRLGEAHVCILSDYAKGVVSARLAEHFIQLAREAGKPVVVDPKGTDYAKYRGATVVTPNVHEVEVALNCEINGPMELQEAGQKLSAILEGSALLITCGPEGMSLFLNGAEVIHIPAVARSVFDVTGAGDTVVAALALALAAGATLQEAACLANYAAGIVVGKFGTATVVLEELLEEVGNA